MQNLLHQLAGVDPLAVGHTSVRRPAILLKVYINIANVSENASPPVPEIRIHIYERCCKIAGKLK